MNSLAGELPGEMEPRKPGRGGWREVQSPPSAQTEARTWPRARSRARSRARKPEAGAGAEPEAEPEAGGGSRSRARKPEGRPSAQTRPRLGPEPPKEPEVGPEAGSRPRRPGQGGPAKNPAQSPDLAQRPESAEPKPWPEAAPEPAQTGACPDRRLDLPRKSARTCPGSRRGSPARKPGPEAWRGLEHIFFAALKTDFLGSRLSSNKPKGKLRAQEGVTSDTTPPWKVDCRPPHVRRLGQVLKARRKGGYNWPIGEQLHPGSSHAPGPSCLPIIFC